MRLRDGLRPPVRCRRVRALAVRRSSVSASGCCRCRYWQPTSVPGCPPGAGRSAGTRTTAFTATERQDAAVVPARSRPTATTRATAARRSSPSTRLIDPRRRLAARRSDRSARRCSSRTRASSARSSCCTGSRGWRTSTQDARAAHGAAGRDLPDGVLLPGALQRVAVPAARRSRRSGSPGATGGGSRRSLGRSQRARRSVGIAARARTLRSRRCTVRARAASGPRRGSRRPRSPSGSVRSLYLVVVARAVRRRARAVDGTASWQRVTAAPWQTVIDAGSDAWRYGGYWLVDARGRRAWC